MDKLMLRKGRVYLFYLLTGLAIASALLLSGCGGGGSGGSGGDESTSARFSFTLTSYLSQTVASQPAAASQPLAVSLVSGQLSVTNTATLVTDIYPWSVYLDDQTLVVTSNGNLVLAPGTYDFALLLTDGAQQYAGTLLNQAVVDGVNNLAMTVQPIIGDTVSDVSAVDNLAEFRFSYDPSELAGFSDPQIGLILDGAPEQIFIVNPATGLGDLWANIPPGPHTIQLRFYDGPTQLGKSVPAQESQTVTAGGNILMDLIALAGDIDFTLTADGGDGTFNFTIPAEIVDEAGGVGNLEALFSLVGTLNPYQEQLLTVLPDGGGNYQAAAVLPGLFYEDVTLSLAFTDIGLSPSQPLGSCLMPVTLGGAQNNLTCNITLVRRAVVGGNLLATVGVTAVDDVGAPVAGASVLIDGVQVGLTNATGFVKVFTLAGPHILRAEAGSTFGEVPLNAAPLGIHNEVVVLDQPLVPSVVFSTLFTDDFNRADGLLTAPWVTTIQGASTLGIVSNQLQAYAPDASPMAMYGSAITPGTPVRTSIDVNISGGNYDNDLNNNGAPIWLLVHSNQSGASWSSAYACGLMNNQLQLLSISVPTITPLATGSQAHSTLNGSSYRIQLTVNAGQLTCESFVGGLPFDSAVASDAAFDGGFTGLLGGDNSTTLKWDNYLLETGSAPAVPASIDGTYVDACRAQGPFDSREGLWNVAAGVITETSNIYHQDTTCSGAIDITNTIVHTLNYTGSKTLGTGELVHTVIVTPTQRLFTPQTQLGADNYNNNVYYGFTDWTVGLTKDVTALNEDGSPNPNTPFQAIAYVDMTVTPNVLRIGTELPVDGLGYPEQLEPGGLPRQ